MDTSTDTTEDQLYKKLKTLNEQLWEKRASRPVIDKWLDNFSADLKGIDTGQQRLHALFLLSQFIYFGDREIRELLKALYRDYFRYPVISRLRGEADDTTDAALIASLFEQELDHTRFLGMGNPSESGTHLLYFFRQENKLRKGLFASVSELFDRRLNDPEVDLADPDVRNIVFVDDFCGSGDQAKRYSRKVLSMLRMIEQRRKIKLRLSCLFLVGTVDALNIIRSETEFDAVDAVLELDSSHRSLDKGSRHFRDAPDDIIREVARSVAAHYGATLYTDHPLGWKEGQLLLGFHHNIPDNSLPIIWWDESSHSWVPVFPRYPKIYS